VLCESFYGWLERERAKSRERCHNFLHVTRDMKMWELRRGSRGGASRRCPF